MFNVSLVNLDPDAHSAAERLATIERSELTDEDLRALLKSFSEIDAVENAVAEPEIRVTLKHQRFRINTGQRKLMLHDVDHRERPALVLTLEEAMAELDGTAQAARNLAASRLVAAEPEIFPARSAPAVAAAPVNKARSIVLGLVTAVLLAAVISVPARPKRVATQVPFRPLARAEWAGLAASLAGVYLTGSEPGQHGIVIVSPEELKLFELSAVAAPRVVCASAQPGRVDSRLALATDQPGGLIEIIDHDTLVYCGEVYRRIP